MSTEQHEALRICEEVTEYTGMTVDESNRAKVHLKEMHALIVQMAEALSEQALFAPHFPCKKQYGNRPASGTVYAVETHGKGEAHLTVEGFHKAADAIAAATQYLKGPKT